ncbi:hypothetical protein ElyMa_000369900 [Elysia marginata]|uniref:SRCR domain-containing protein n=1 Tax=Elysia marginata TaxID=1093978 RepID=A0AAV4FGD1_9GAST|nr:hypothetical protein ElyMa_000369900 [Elysia marginata]
MQHYFCLSQTHSLISCIISDACEHLLAFNLILNNSWRTDTSEDCSHVVTCRGLIQGRNVWTRLTTDHSSGWPHCSAPAYRFLLSHHIQTPMPHRTGADGRQAAARASVNSNLSLSISVVTSSM